jgi:indolepyruvate ferredoxin oxidoreductase beta subunit
MKKLEFDPLNIIICGIGGQGNVLASEIVASALNDMGYKVAVGETYGASQRGGSVMSHVRVSETETLGVLIPSGEAHIIIGFEPLETLRMARQYAGANTMIIYDPRPVYPLGVLQGNQSYPPVEAIGKELEALASEAHAVNAADIALDIGDTRAANVALLGAFSRLPGSPLSTEELSGILAQRFSGKALEINQKAFALGCAAMDAKGGSIK